MNLILDCSPLSAGGGIQVGLSLIHHAARAENLSLHVVATEQFVSQIDEETRRMTSSVSIVSKESFIKKLRLKRSLLEIEKRVKPDLVFTVFGPSYWRSKTVCLQGFALGKMLYPLSRASYRSSLARWKEEFSDVVKKYLFKRNADYFVVETDVVKARLSEVIGIPFENIFVVRNSYSPAFEKRCSSTGCDVRALASEFTIFVPASFYFHKNLEIIPAVAAELRVKTNKMVRFVFTLPPESQGWRRIWHRASELGVEASFETVGAVPNGEIADYYLRSDAVLCTSLVESSTAVFPEAFMARRPLLVSDLDFSRQLCGEAALFFDPHDHFSIAGKILELMGDEKLLCELVEKGGEQLIKNYPSPDAKWVQQLEVIQAVVRLNRYN